MIPAQQQLNLTEEELPMARELLRHPLMMRLFSVVHARRPDIMPDLLRGGANIDSNHVAFMAAEASGWEKCLKEFEVVATEPPTNAGGYGAKQSIRSDKD